MGEVFAGRYELVDPLASGGGGVIWRVWDLRQDEYRAGKVLKQSHSDSLLRFMRETSWRVEHRHVITPLGWVGEDDKVMFTMPLIRGGSLAQIIKEQGALPPVWAVQVIDQLLQALAAVHDQGLVHRDLKPANLLLEPTPPSGGAPYIYLSDFGIAAPIGDPRMTRVTEVIGTPGYMSPEAQYGADPTPQQDLYAVGVLLLEMLTGRRPPAEGVPEIPAAAAHVPLGRWIAKLLDEETKRYQTAGSAREALLGTVLPPAGNRAIVVPDRIPDFPEGWTAHGPEQATTLRPASGRSAARQPSQDGIPSGGSAVSLPAGQQLPMQPSAGSQQHEPAPGWDAPGTGTMSRGAQQLPTGPGSPTPAGAAGYGPGVAPTGQHPVGSGAPMTGAGLHQGHLPAGLTSSGQPSSGPLMTGQGGPLSSMPGPAPGQQPLRGMPPGGAVATQQGRPSGWRGLLDRYAALPEPIGWGLLAIGLIVAGLALWGLIG